MTPDQCGEASLFQAQVRRVESYLALADPPPAAPSGPTLLLIDELLSSTNPMEATALSCAYAERLAQCRGSLAIITTHLPSLTRLERQLGRGRFVNWCVNPDTHALHHGACTESSAIALLRRETRALSAAALQRADATYQQLCRATLTAPQKTPIIVKILHGSSCVGKSTLMHREDDRFDKVEMDDSEFWKVDKSEWPSHCRAYLVERVAANTLRKDMVITCGGLPLPNDAMYPKIAQEHSITFVHTLVLVRTTEDYKHNIAERGLSDKTQELLRNYAWRESTKALHDEVVYCRKKRVI